MSPDLTPADELYEAWTQTPGCTWHVTYFPWEVRRWTVQLKWSAGAPGLPGAADTAVYTWGFAGKTVEEAVDLALGWCRRLIEASAF